MAPASAVAITNWPTGFGWKEALLIPFSAVSPKAHACSPAQIPCPSGESPDAAQDAVTGVQPREVVAAICWLRVPLVRGKVTGVREVVR